MPLLSKIRGAVVAVAVLLIGGALLSGPRDQAAIGGPTALPSPRSVPPETASLVLETFTSTLHGYSIQHPQSWRSTPATRSWTAGLVIPHAAYTDTFHPERTTPGAAVAIAARPIQDGVTALEWMNDWARYREALGGPCVGPASAWKVASVAGASARRIEGVCDFAQAGQSFAELAWVIDGTAYVISGTPSVVDSMAASFQAP